MFCCKSKALAHTHYCMYSSAEKAINEHYVSWVKDRPWRISGMAVYSLS